MSEPSPFVQKIQKRLADAQLGQKLAEEQIARLDQQREQMLAVRNGFMGAVEQLNAVLTLDMVEDKPNDAGVS